MRGRNLCAALCLACYSATAFADDREIRIGAASSIPDQGHLPSADIAAIVAETLASLSGSNPILPDRRVRIVPVDDKCTRERGIEAANALVAARVHVVIGHICASAAIAVAPIYAAAGILFIAPGVRHAGLTTPRAGPLVFRMAGRNDRLGADIAVFLTRRSTSANVAVLYDKSAQSRDIASSIGRTLTAAGLRPAHEKTFTSGEKTYEPLMRKLAGLAIDIAFVPTQAPELAIMMRDAAAIAPSMKFIGSELLAIPYIEPVAAVHSDRLIVMLPWPDRSLLPGSGLEIAAPSIADAAKASARLAVETWAHAVRRAGSFESAEIARLLTNDPAPTHAGPIRFDNQGDAEVPSYTPHVWRGGRWRPLESDRSR